MYKCVTIVKPYTNKQFVTFKIDYLLDSNINKIKSYS